jgi:DNA-binding protein HU-beta
MNKKQIASHIAQQCDYPRKKTRKIIDAFLRSVFESLLNGEEVILRHFGRFYLAEVQEKRSFDPYNKVMFALPKHTKVKFSASQKMKDLVKNIEVK